MTLDELSRRYGRRFDFTTTQMSDHRALTAVRRPGAAGRGLYAVITDDPQEMLRALRDDADPGG